MSVNQPYLDEAHVSTAFPVFSWVMYDHTYANPGDGWAWTTYIVLRSVWVTESGGRTSFTVTYSWASGYDLQT